MNSEDVKEIIGCIMSAWLDLIQEQDDQKENQRRAEETFGLEVVN